MSPTIVFVLWLHFAAPWSGPRTDVKMLPGWLHLDSFASEFACKSAGEALSPAISPDKVICLPVGMLPPGKMAVQDGMRSH